MVADVRSEGSYVCDFIEKHCRITRGDRTGDLVRLLPFQRELLTDLFELREDGRRRYRRAYVQIGRKNGKTFLLACTSLYEALMGEIGGEVYFVAADRQQASRAFDECKRIIEQDAELASLFRVFRYHCEVPQTGTILRVLSADASLQAGLSPSFVCFDEVAMQPTDRLWSMMSLGSGARSQPLLVGISTPGWERDSLAFRLYQHGRAVASGETQDPSFYFKAWEPADSECDHTSPLAWADANPALGEFLNLEDFQAAVASTPEHEFRRFRLGQWTSTKDAALPAGAWDALTDKNRVVPPGSSIIVGFDGSRVRDCTALCACTITDPHIWPIEIWEPTEHERVDPKDVAEAIRQTCHSYDVRELICDESLWSWVLFELAEEGAPVVVMPQTPQRSISAWQRISDAIAERRITHNGDPRVARHFENLVLKSDRFGQRPTRDRTGPRLPIDAAMASIWSYDRAAQQEEPREPMVAFV